MNTSTPLQETGYSGIKVTSMLKACLSSDIKPHLRLVQLDSLTAINNKHFKTGSISKAEMTLLWNVYWNFVLNDFRFEDKSEPTIPTKVVKISNSHIGILTFNNLQHDN